MIVGVSCEMRMNRVIFHDIHVHVMDNVLELQLTFTCKGF